MISGGNATVYVSDISRAVKFYSQALGFKVLQQYNDRWALIDAGSGLLIGLHLITSKDSHHQPGHEGSISIGFNAEAKLEDVIVTLKDRGVEFRSNIVDSPESPVRLAFFGDQDGNELYLIEDKLDRNADVLK